MTQYGGGEPETIAELPDPNADPGPLRGALLRADFTVDGLLERLGAVAYAALARGETVPALRATASGTPLDTLIRLFLLRRPVPASDAAEALPLAGLRAAGWLREAASDAEADAGPSSGLNTGTETETETESGTDTGTAHPVGSETASGTDSRPAAGSADEVYATVGVRPYAGPAGQDWWIVSDTGHAVGGGHAGPGAAGSPGGPDVVVGAGGASTTLAHLAVPGPVSRALDLGSGSGIQTLHLAERAASVTATDVNPRALHMTRLTVALSAVPEPLLLGGSLFEPLADEERYDLIVSNPPFVISPRVGAAPRLTYRDAGMDGDEVCRTLVRGSAERLTDGGWCQLLANWLHVVDEDWRERVAAWVPPGCDAWIVQREEQDVAEYAELWLRDAGLHLADPDEYAARYEQWLDEFAARRARAVGFGWITLRRTSSPEPVVVVEEWPHAVQQPLGGEIRRHFDRVDFLRQHDDAALLERCYELAEGVVQEQIGQPGAEDPEHVVLRQRHGMMRAITVDTVSAGLVGSCDGELPAGRIVDAIGQLLGEDPTALRAAVPDTLRTLVEQGFVHPVAG